VNVRNSKILIPSHSCQRDGAYSLQPETSLHRDHGYVVPVHRVVCPSTPQLSLVFITPTHGGMARLI